MQLIPDNQSKVVGVKQTRRAIAEGAAKKVLIAVDADPRVTEPIQQLCAAAGVPTQQVESMRELGQACGIEVSASVVALL